MTLEHCMEMVELSVDVQSEASELYENCLLENGYCYATTFDVVLT